MKPEDIPVEVALLKQIAENTGKIVGDHESRLRKIERWMMYGSGLAAAGSLALHFFETVKH